MNFTSNETILLQLNPLLHNISCESPHSDDPKVYTYILDDDFVGVSTFIAVINFLAIIPTSLLNSLIILAMVQQKELRTTSNRLLFSICAADLIIGILVEPIFGAHIIQITKGSHQCGLANFMVYIVPIMIVITMVTHMVIALERYSSIHFIKAYKKIFTKRYITLLTALIWGLCLICFVLPFITGDPVLGTRIIVTLILVSLAVCSFCYISIYQDHKWKHGKPTAKIEGPYIVRGAKPSKYTETELKELEKNVHLASFFSRLFLWMVVFYVLNLTKNVLNSYNIFSGNGHYLVHFIFETLLFLNALCNPGLILWFSPEITKAATMVFM